MVRVPNLPQIGRQRQVAGFSAGPRIQQFDSAPTMPSGENATSQLAGRVQGHINRGAVLSADTILSEKAAKLQAEYRQKLGLDATNEAVRDAMRKGLADERDKLLAAMGNNDQRAEFGLQAQRTLAEHGLAIDKHYGEQSTVYEFQASSARSSGAAEAYRDNYLNGLSDAAAGNMETIDAEERNMAKLKGAAPEAVGGLVRDAKTRAHASTIDKMLNDGQSTLASQYLAEAKKRGEISPDGDAKLGDAVRKAQVGDDALRFARATMSNLAGEGSLAEQKARAMQMLNGALDQGKMTPEAFRRTSDTLRTLYGQQMDDDAGVAVSVRDRSKQWFTQPGNETANYSDFERANPSLAVDVDRLNLRPELTNFVENGQRDTTDYDTWLRVQDMSDERITGMSAVQLNAEFGGSLSKRDTEALLARRARAGGKATKEQMRMLSQKDWTDRTWDEMWTMRNGSPLPANASPQQKADYQKQKEDWLVTFEDGRLRNWQAKYGPADTSALRELLGQEKADLVEVLVPGMLFDGIKITPAAMASKDEMGTAMVNSGDPIRVMPEVIDYKGRTWTKADIAARLVADGHQPTLANIQRYWREFMSGAGEQPKPGELIQQEAEGVILKGGK